MRFEDDSRLARRAQRGDRQAFETIVVRFQRPIYSFIYNFFQNTAHCEDITQETFLRAFRFIKSFRAEEKLSTWLFSIAKNLCIDELRRMQKGATVPIDLVDTEAFVSEAAGNPVTASIQIQEGEILRRAIRRLPDRYRACIVLFYFNELSYEEISSVMGLSLSNTKILLFRGKKLLSELYREETRSKL